MFMPNFLGIGAMRSGTSWFAKNLREHPDIWMREKELHFFDRKLEQRKLRFIPRNLEAKLRYMKNFTKGVALRKVVGEFTPAYAILDQERIALVHSWIPKAKLLYIMRNPVERTWSHARKDFPEFLGKSVTEATESELRAFFESPGVCQRVDYATCLENWMAFYDSKSFFITFLEDVRIDPEKVLRDAFSFLGVDPNMGLNPETMGTTVNSRPNVQMPDWVRDYLYESVNQQVNRLESLIGRKAPW